MFETMMSGIAMVKDALVWVLVFMQTGMGPNYVFENTSEMAAFSRAWLDTWYTVDDAFRAAPAIIGCAVIIVVTGVLTVKLTKKYVYKED